MRIGILGGSFNPPHISHILVARQVLDFTDIDRVWFLPAYKHTFDKPLAQVKHRLAMTKLVKFPQTQVSTLEIDYQLDGNTVNLLLVLQKNPADSFTFIIGSDQLPSFTKWGNWQELLKHLPFLVVPRAGYPLRPLYKGMTALSHPLFVTTNISSSMVRQRIKTGLQVEHFVTKEVKDYIEKHQLYK